MRSDFLCFLFFVLAGCSPAVRSIPVEVDGPVERHGNLFTGYTYSVEGSSVRSDFTWAFAQHPALAERVETYYALGEAQLAVSLVGASLAGYYVLAAVDGRYRHNLERAAVVGGSALACSFVLGLAKHWVHGGLGVDWNTLDWP